MSNKPFRFIAFLLNNSDSEININTIIRIFTFQKLDSFFRDMGVVAHSIYDKLKKEL